MVQQLKDFIEKLKSNPKISSFDEASTKQAIVLPMLYLLGWDTQERDDVTPEYSVGNRRVDYALRNNNKNKFFLEVKKPSEDLSGHDKQLLDYSFQQGVELATLTNGITWWFYLPMKGGVEWASRKFYTIDIIQQEIDIVSSKLVALLSKDNLLSGEAVKEAESIYEDRLKKKTIKDTLPEAWNKIISDTDTLLVDLLTETTEKICGYKPEIDDVKQFLKRSAIPEPLLPPDKNSRKRSNTNVDRFGRRLGTQGAAIDATLSTKPKTIEEIMKETNLSRSRVRGHINWLRKTKFVEITDKGVVCIKP